MASSPAIVGDELVVHGMDGVVRVLDRRNGRLRWSYRVGSPIESSPVVRGGLDYFGAWNGRVYALDLSRRKLRWSYRTGYKITSSAVARRADALHRRLRRPPARALGPHRPPPLRPLGQRPRLRHARGRRRPRLRALLDRQQPDRVHDRAAATSGASARAATSTRRPPSGPGASSSAPTTAASTRSRRARAGCSGASRAGGPVSGAAVVVDGVAYAGSTWGRITGVDAKSGRVLLRFPHGEYVPVSGNGAPAAPARLLAPLGGRAPQAVKRWLLALAVVLLLGAGIVAGYVLLQARPGRGRARLLDGRVRHDRGGEPPPPPPPPQQETLEVVWPTERLRRGAAARRAVSTCGRPSGASGRSGRASCSSSRPRSATAASTSRTTRASCSPSTRRRASAPGSMAIGRCVAASPAVGDHTVYQSFLNRPPCNSKAKPGRLEGEVIAFAAGFGKVRWRTRIGPTESSPLVATGCVYVGDWRGRVYALDANDRPRALDVPGQGPDQGRGRALRQPALRRHLQRLPLRARTRRPAR